MGFRIEHSAGERKFEDCPQNGGGISQTGQTTWSGLATTLRTRNFQAKQSLISADVKAIFDSKCDWIRNAIIYSRVRADEAPEQDVTDQKHVRPTAE